MGSILYFHGGISSPSDRRWLRGGPRFPAVGSQEVKSNHRLDSIPLVVFTTSIEGDDRRLSLDLGADLFISKPQDFHEWIRISKWLIGRYCVACSQGRETS
jgi:CheY-like chemotaxis protein